MSTRQNNKGLSAQYLPATDSRRYPTYLNRSAHNMKKLIKASEMIIYKTKSGAVEFRADIGKETLWATQAQMAQVFGVNPQAVTKHLKNIYREGELNQKATCSKMEQVRKEGGRLVRRNVDIGALSNLMQHSQRKTKADSAI